MYVEQFLLFYSSKYLSKNYNVKIKNNYKRGELWVQYQYVDNLRVMIGLPE